MEQVINYFKEEYMMMNKLRGLKGCASKKTASCGGFFISYPDTGCL